MSEERRVPKKVDDDKVKELNRVTFDKEHIFTRMVVEDMTLTIGLCTLEKKINFKEIKLEELRKYIFWVYYSFNSSSYKQVEYKKEDSADLESALNGTRDKLGLKKYNNLVS